VLWACGDAFSAQDAFRVSVHGWYIDAHGADICTGVAMDTIGSIHRNVKDADFVKGCEQCPDWAEVAAPATLNQENQGKEQKKNNEGDREEIVWHKFPWVQDQYRDCSCEETNRADIRKNKSYEK